MPANAFRSLGDMPELKSWHTDLEIHNIYFLIHGLMGYRNNDPSLKRLLENWTNHDYKKALSTLNRLEFVYVVDRFSALLEDIIRFRFEDKPLEAFAAKKRNVPSSLTLDEMQKQIESATASLAHGSLTEVIKKVSALSGIIVLKDSELAFARYAIELRNLLVHRGEIIDAKFLERSKTKTHMIGNAVQLPRADDVRLVLKGIASRVGNRLNFGTGSHVSSRKYTGAGSNA